MKHLRLKKIISITMAIFIFLNSFPVSAFAQELTPSPQPQQSSPLLTPEEQILQNLPDLSASTSADTNLPSPSFSDNSNNPSAVFRPQAFVARLSKTSFQAKEKIELVVRNASEKDDFRVEVKSERQSDIKVHTDKKFVNGEYVFSINPEVGMRPGKYTVTVIDNSTNEVMSSQDFTWGVLAINTNKSIYASGETANIAMAVLDEKGNMVCDAVVSLQITAPWGEKTNLSTEDGTILVNPDCKVPVAQKPDYEAFYLTTDVGRYNMTLTATTANGTYTVKDRFEVRQYVPFDVERVTATRIYPPETYPVTLKIKANEAFRGKIVESVPQDFQITPGEEGTISYSEETIIPESYDPKTETNIPDLPLPFDGDYTVTLGFGEQLLDKTEISVYKKSGLDGHDGIDFALPRGTPVLSVDAGKVILAKENWIYGHTVVIEHSWGRSYYGHLSEIKIGQGSFVQKGTQLGFSGSTGLSTGPHLHFGLKPKINDIDNLYFGKIDPAPFFGLANEDPTLSTADYPIAAKALVWNIDVEAGSEFTIGYQYKAPNKSPYFYTIGPLQFITSDIKAVEPAKFDVQLNPFVLGTATESGKLAITENTELSAESTEQQQSSHEAIEPFSSDAVVFSEIRQWQIAVDTPGADFTIQRGCELPAAGTGTVTLTAGTDYTAPADNTKAFIRMVSTRLSGMGNTVGGGTQEADDFTWYISDPDFAGNSVVFTRAGTTNPQRFCWEIIEYVGSSGGANEIAVLDVAAITYGTTETTIDGSSVSPANDADVVVFVTGQNSVETADQDEVNAGYSTSEWVGASDIPRFTRGFTGADANSISYAVVEFTGSNWGVQRVEHTFTADATEETETITDVGDIARAFFHAQFRLDEEEGLDDSWAEMWISATTTVSFQTQAASGSLPSQEHAVVWVIRNSDTTAGTKMNVQHISGSRLATGTSEGAANEEDEWTDTITAVGDIAQSSIMGENGRSAGNGAAYPRGNISLYLNSTTGVKLYHSDDANLQRYRFQVVEWPLTDSGGEPAPALNQLMRHGKWFNSSGEIQPFTF